MTTPNLVASPQLVSWKTGRNFSDVHFVSVDSAPLTICGRRPDGVIDHDPPFTADTMCRMCSMLYRRPLRMVR